MSLLKAKLLLAVIRKCVTNTDEFCVFVHQAMIKVYVL